MSAGIESTLTKIDDLSIEIIVTESELVEMKDLLNALEALAA